MEIKLPHQAAKALERLERAGFEGYIVGGCVRDSIMGRVPGDYDITTSARPEQVLECFAGERVIPTGIKHGTVTVVLDGMPLEMTTYRADGEYTDHRRPDSVAFSDRLSDDLCRRDFTINAMAYSPERGLVDMYGGARDIELRVIRCVGDAGRRFEEDALRMLRAVRFASTLDFSIDGDTLDALRAHTDDIAYVARERVFAELNKAVCAALPRRAFEAGRGLVEAALAIKGGLGVYDAALGVMERTPCEAALRWAALLHELGAERAREALMELRAPKALADRVCAAIEGCKLAFSSERADILRMLNRLGVQGLNDALELARARALWAGENARADLLHEVRTRAAELANSGACFTLRALAIGGDDLRALGFAGREIGGTLNALLELVMSGEANNDGAELRARAIEMRSTGA